MAYVAVDFDGCEFVYEELPHRGGREYNFDKKWYVDTCEVKSVELPKGCIEKLVGKKITWDDEPILLS